jgi:hypothetical protein
LKQSHGKVSSLAMARCVLWTKDDIVVVVGDVSDIVDAVLVIQMMFILLLALA